MVAAVECEVEDGLVFYSRFRDEPSRTAAYDALVASSTIESDAGPGCASGATEAAFGGEDGEADGRLLCHLTNGAHISVWTHADEPILAGILLAADAGFPVLASTWEAARLLSVGAIDEAPASPAPGTPDGPTATAMPEGPTGSGTPAASVEPAPSASATPTTAGTPPPVASGGEPLVQWASSATASSMYGPDAWSATQATGEPDTSQYGDRATAWAPSGADIGPQWIELGYDVAVRPTEIVIWESSGAGFVTRVEAVDLATGDWVTLFEGIDGSPDFLVGFSPPLETIEVVTDRLRITIDTDVPGWNEIDAVALIGVPADPA